jgi:purine-binding chemotaxis protein CheW
MLNQLLAFTLDARHYAVPLDCVRRIVRIVEPTPLPKAPEIVTGVINMGGNIIPVLDIRKRFSLPCREATLSDQLIVANTRKRTVALAVDSVTGIVERPAEQITTVAEVVPGTKYVAGVTKFHDDVLLIHDLDEFLFPEEDKQLEVLASRT